MKITGLIGLMVAGMILTGCDMLVPLQWTQATPEQEAEYQPFLKNGTPFLLSISKKLQ